MANSEAVRYGCAVAGRLREVLGEEDLHGAYLGGSVALGGYVPGQSDIDIIAVCRRSLGANKKQTVAQAISREAARCPTRGLEFVLYSLAAVAVPSRTPRFEINLNAGPEMDYHLSFDPASEPAHWSALDISIPLHHRLGPGDQEGQPPPQPRRR